MTNTHQADPVEEEPAVIWRAAICGHHHKDGCTSCESSHSMNNSNLDELRARIATLETRLAHMTEAAEEMAALPWNEEVAFILGRPCFMFIKEAQLFRSLGYDIPTKAEDEQAFFIHRWLNFYLQHGDGWRDAAATDMRDHIARASLQPEEPR